MKKVSTISSSAIRRLSISILRSKSPEADLSASRQSLATADFGQLQDELFRVRRGGTRVFGVLVAPTVAQLRRAVAPRTVDWEREVKWAKSVLSRHPTELNCFVRLKDDFSAALLAGQYEVASYCLEQIEQQFGQSLWLIKHRIALLQLSAGLEPQKRYAQQVKEGFDYTGPVALITQWVSTRNEGTVTPSRFVSDFSQLLTRIEQLIPQGFAEYLRYHVLTPEAPSLAAAEHLLRIESTRALVDYYEAFISFGQVTALLGKAVHKAAAGYAIQRLLPKVNDPRLPVLLTALGRVIDPGQLSAEPAGAYDAFRQGHYQEAAHAAATQLQYTADNAPALVVAALSNALTTEQQGLSTPPTAASEGGTGLQQTLVKQLAAVVRGGMAASRAVHELNKLTLNFAALEWAMAPLLLLTDEATASLDIGSSTAAVALRVPRWHPMLLEAFGPHYATGASIEATVKQNPKSFSLQVALGLIGAKNAPVGGLSLESHQLLEGHRSYATRHYEQAVGYGQALGNSIHSYFRRRGHRLVANSLLTGGKLMEACTFMAVVYVREPHLQPLLPLAEAVGNLRPSQPEWAQLKSSLALPILLDAYTKHLNRTSETLCGYAYEDFLTTNGLERPSQLRHQREGLDPEQVVYYLRYVCVESVMDTSTVYQSSREVADERLAVCRLLVELDTVRADDYRAEIKDLVRQQVISERKHEVEQSRIHVELPKLHVWAAAQLQESYHRYLALVKAGIDSESIALRAEAADKAGRLDYEGLLAMSVPNNETNALFRTMVVELRDAYTSNAEFGLNRYLSTRIRHGTLETQLRRPLTTHQLITQRESENGPYQENTYWPITLALEATESERLNSILMNFSAGYDNLISGIRTEWMQIRHAPDQLGLFEFTLAEGELAFLAAGVEADTTFRQFVDMVVEYLGRRLTGSLAIIRQRLRTEAWPVARELLNSLQLSTQAINEPYVFGELETAINLARTETHAVFERVTGWFRPTQAVGDSPYKLEDVLSVAEALVQEVSPAFTAPLAMGNEDTLIMLAHGFPVLVDVFVNVFENVVRRSGLETPEARLAVVMKGLSPELSVVSITSTNALGLAVNREELQQRLTQKQRELDEGEYASSIATEGGSGFYKIHRSLRDFRLSELEPEATLRFEVLNDEFVVEIQLPIYIQASLAATESPYDQVQVLLDMKHEHTAR